MSIASSITDSLGGESAGGDFKHHPRTISVTETSPLKSKMVSESPQTAAVITRRASEDDFPQTSSYPNEPRAALTRAENNDAVEMANAPQTRRDRYDELVESDDETDSGHGSPGLLLPMANWLSLRQLAFNQLNGILELHKEEERDNFRCTVSGRTFKDASISQFFDARTVELQIDMAMSLKTGIPFEQTLTLQECYAICYGYEVKNLGDPVVVDSRGDYFPLECVEMITADMP